MKARRAQAVLYPVASSGILRCQDGTLSSRGFLSCLIV